MTLLQLFKPSRDTSSRVLGVLGVGWALVLLSAWAVSPHELLPAPGEVARASLIMLRRGLAPHLLSSLSASWTALGWAALISLGLAYCSVVPLVRPLAEMVCKLRFWGFAGVSVALTVLFHGGHDLKIALLVFGMVGFFSASMYDEVRAIPEERFDYARSLGMNEFRVCWEVVVRGTLDRALDILRQNAAMSWMLLTFVETVVRSEGGVGVLLANQSKHMDLASVAALQIVIFAIGVCQDYALTIFKNLLCPHARFKITRSN
jgi:NitT/TauT family transport system permease protein